MGRRQATAAARYNLEIMVRHARGEITTQQLRAFLAPMQPEDEIHEQLRILPDDEFDALLMFAREQGFSPTLIGRERRKRKRRERLARG